MYSIFILGRIVLGTDHQSSSFPCSSINRFYQINHFLLIFHCPINLIVVSRPQIDHYVFVSVKKHDCARIVYLVHLVKVGNLGYIHLHIISIRSSLNSSWNEPNNVDCDENAPDKQRQSSLPGRQCYTTPRPFSYKSDPSVQNSRYYLHCLFPLCVRTQSCPNRITTARSSSFSMAWSTCQPDFRCGRK